MPENPDEQNSAKPEGTEPRKAPPTSVQPVQSAGESTKDESQPPQKEVLEENVDAAQSEQQPELAAGLHSTGSFSEASKAEKN